MYYKHFGLDGPPFRFVPSAAVLYLGEAHRECLAALEWALVHDECGFMLLVGETGTGKTTLLNAIFAHRLPNLRLACVTNPRLSFTEIMRVVLPQLGVTTNERGKLELIQALERVVANLPQGHRVAIAIDEAQDLSDETLEDLRLLANRLGARDHDLQIVLMGHPELLDRLSAHHLRQLPERISTKVCLAPLNAAESVAYVEYRLVAQNGNTQIFDAKALSHIVQAAAGIPRRLNVLCHNALLLAYTKNANPVSLGIAREVVNDYQSIFRPSSEKRPVSRTAESATRPRRGLVAVRAVAACAALAVVGFGSALIAKTHNWTGMFNRTAPPIAGASAPANREVADSSASDKVLAPTPADAASISPASTSVPNTSTASPSESGRTIIQIHAGDTFHDLAAKYLGSTDRTGDLIKANPQIKNPDSLFVGETIYLPSTQ